MDDTYVECQVEAVFIRKMMYIEYALLSVTGLFTAMTLTSGFIVWFLIALGAGIGAYYAKINSEVEYEYLYMHEEMVIDKILGRRKRKRAENLRLDRVKIIAPINSRRLEMHRSKNATVKDYSCGYAAEPDQRYILCYEGGKELILSPSERFIQVLKNNAPRKVFTD
jgi:hypothetical protein